MDQHPFRYVYTPATPPSPGPESRHNNIPVDPQASPPAVDSGVPPGSPDDSLLASEVCTSVSCAQSCRGVSLDTDCLGSVSALWEGSEGVQNSAVPDGFVHVD